MDCTKSVRRVASAAAVAENTIVWYAWDSWDGVTATHDPRPQ